MNRQRFGLAGVALALAGSRSRDRRHVRTGGPAGTSGGARRWHPQADLPGRAGIDGSAHQLHAAGLAARAGNAGWAASTSRRPRGPPRTRSYPISRSRSRSRRTAARRGSSSCAPASSSRTDRSLKPSDVLASFQRIFKVHGPTAASFYGSIVGAAACLKAAATCTLKGGVVANDAKGTVTFNLTKPDGEWLQQLAVPLASILPAATPPKDQGTKPVPGHGPVHDQVLRPEPPDHARAQSVLQAMVDGRPAGTAIPTRSRERFDLTGEAAVTQVENGQADWIGFSIPSDRLGEIATKYPKQLFLNQLTAMWYVPMNTRLAPFNNLKARQAVNYAVDRGAAVRLFGGAEARHPELPDPARRLPRPRRLLPVHEEPGQEVDRARSGQGQGARQGLRHGRPEGRARRPGRCRRQGDRHLSAEPAEPARLEGLAQGAGRQHPVHLHPEHQEPRADQPLAVVSGLPGGVGLPERAASDARPSARAATRASTSPASATSRSRHRWTRRRRSALPIRPGPTSSGRRSTRRSPTRRAAAVLFAPKNTDFVSKRVGNFIFSAQYYMLLDQAWVQ